MEGFLSEREREELRTAHRHESQVRYADRIKAVLLLDSTWPINKITEALLLDSNTIRRYKELYLSEGIDGLCNDNYHGRVCALRQRDQKELCKALRTKIYLSTVEIVLSSDSDRTHFTFNHVVIEMVPAIFKDALNLTPLVKRIFERLHEGGFWQGFSCQGTQIVLQFLENWQ